MSHYAGNTIFMYTLDNCKFCQVIKINNFFYKILNKIMYQESFFSIWDAIHHYDHREHKENVRMWCHYNNRDVPQFTTIPTLELVSKISETGCQLCEVGNYTNIFMFKCVFIFILGEVSVDCCWCYSL